MFSCYDDHLQTLACELHEVFLSNALTSLGLPIEELTVEDGSCLKRQFARQFFMHHISPVDDDSCPTLLPILSFE